MVICMLNCMQHMSEPKEKLINNIKKQIELKQQYLNQRRYDYVIETIIKNMCPPVNQKYILNSNLIVDIDVIESII